MATIYNLKLWQKLFFFLIAILGEIIDSEPILIVKREVNQTRTVVEETYSQKVCSIFIFSV